MGPWCRASALGSPRAAPEQPPGGLQATAPAQAQAPAAAMGLVLPLPVLLLPLLFRAPATNAANANWM